MTNSTHSRPNVGIGVIIMKGNTVLLGKRIGSHGKNTWSFPGGNLEYGESFEACALRETAEECGVTIANLRKGPYTNDVHEKESRHVVTIFMLADFVSGEAQILEPEKCELWSWFPWNELPQPLFLPVAHLVKDGFNPFTSST